MTLAKAKALRANEIFIVQASLTIITYDHQNIFIVQATGAKTISDYRFFKLARFLNTIQLITSLEAKL